MLKVGLRRRVHLCLATILLLACGGDPSGPSPAEELVQDATLVPVTDMGDHYWPENAWRSASASDAGMNETQLFISLQNLRAANPLLRSVVVVRHGYRVIGRYFNSSAIDLHTLQSVSKSVTSLLVGIALDKRLIQSPDQTAVSFFPEYADIRNMDDRKQRLTLLDLLSMKTGMAFFESPYPGSPLQQLNDCGCDWLHFVLDTPMSGEPGNQWAYNSGGVILLGGVLRAVSGVPADEFAQQNLFAKLGIARYSWYKGLPNGLPHMGGGLLLTADDLARIGYLVLRHGRWNEDQVVSADWIDRSTARTSQSISGYFPRSADYGLLWWLFPRNGINGSGSNGDYIIAASGTGGQWLFVDPANDLVAVFLSDLGGGSWPSFNYFFDEILPSIER